MFCFCTRDDREWTFTSPFSPTFMQLIPTPSHFQSIAWVLFPIPMGFPLGYSHSHPIPKHAYSKAMKCKSKQLTVERQKTTSQKTGHQHLTNRNSTPWRMQKKNQFSFVCVSFNTWQKLVIFFAYIKEDIRYITISAWFRSLLSLRDY